MRIRFENGNLEALAKTVLVAFEDATLHVEDKEVMVRVLDPAHVVMVEARTPADVDGAGDLGVDFEILRRTGACQAEIMEVQDGLLWFHAEHGSFRFAQVKARPVAEPLKGVYTASFTAKVSALARIVEAASYVATGLRIAVHHDGVNFCTTEKEASFQAAWSGHPTDVDDDAPHGRQVGVYALDYLEGLLRAMPEDGEVKVSLSEDAPMLLEWQREGVACRAWIAPRLEEGA